MDIRDDDGTYISRGENLRDFLQGSVWLDCQDLTSLRRYDPRYGHVPLVVAIGERSILKATLRARHGSAQD